MQAALAPLSGPADVRRRIAAAGLVLGSIGFSVGELLHHQAPGLYLPAAAVALLGLYFWIGGILGLVHLLRADADRLGLLGGAAALLGLVAVTNIMLLQLVFVILDRDTAANADTVAEVFRVVLSVTYLFGPVFPAGLALLAIGLLRARVFPTWITVCFLIGALAFPAGRMLRIPWLLHVSDLVLTLGAVGIGACLWRRPELWTRRVAR